MSIRVTREEVNLQGTDRYESSAAALLIIVQKCRFLQLLARLGFILCSVFMFWRAHISLQQPSEHNDMAVSRRHCHLRLLPFANFAAVAVCCCS